MIGELVNGRADIIVAAADFTYDRQVNVDFFTPMLISRYVLVIKNTKVHGKDVYSTYARVFSCTSWIIIVTFAFVSSIFIFKKTRFRNPQKGISYPECLLIAFGAICNKGHTLKLRFLSEKLLFNTMFLLGLLLNTYYSSYLVSLLAVNEPEIPFTNIEGLYQRRNEYKFDFTRGGSLNILIKESPREILSKVWKDLVDESYKENPVFLTEEQSLHRVLTENVALLISEKYFLNNFFDTCDFVLIPEAVFNVPSGWAMRKKSPLFPVINHRLQKLVEGGIYKRLLHQTRPFSPDFCSTSSVFQPFCFIKVASIFIAYGIGISISFLILAIEILISKNQRCCKRF